MRFLSQLALGLITLSLFALEASALRIPPKLLELTIERIRSAEHAFDQTGDDVSAWTDRIVLAFNRFEGGGVDEWDQFVSKHLNPNLDHIQIVEISSQRHNELGEPVFDLKHSPKDFLVGFMDQLHLILASISGESRLFKAELVDLSTQLSGMREILEDIGIAGLGISRGTEIDLHKLIGHFGDIQTIQSLDQIDGPIDDFPTMSLRKIEEAHETAQRISTLLPSSPQGHSAKEILGHAYIREILIHVTERLEFLAELRPYVQ